MRHVFLIFIHLKDTLHTCFLFSISEEDDEEKI